MADLLPPTGLKIESFVRDNIVEWYGSDNPAVVGYNLYVSSTSGGGQSRYFRLNNTVLTTPDRIESIVESEESDEVETLLGGQKAEQTVITRRKVSKVPVFQFHHRNVDMNSRLFYVVTSVDANGAESGFSTELVGETTRIDATVLNVVPRNFSEIVNGIIGTLLRRDPEIDLKPGTVVRDLVIEPQGFELEKLWFLLNFIDKGNSLISLRAIDDENDDSITDPVSQSSYKQQLQAALGITSDEETQALVDFAMEKLAANARVFRKASSRAQGEVIFYVDAQPPGNVEIPVGTAVWTAPGESGAVIGFSTTSPIIARDVDMDFYYNATRERYEFHAPVMADDPGPFGNISVGAIVNTSVSQLLVTNLAPTFGGAVAENNSMFTERAVLKYSSLDVGTAKGYRRILLEQPGVTDVHVAGADDPLMQRDFIRHVSLDGIESEHVFGKVDLWARGSESVVYEDRVGFLFKRVEAESFDIIERLASFTIETTNSDVGEDTPIFEVKKITRQRAGVQDADYILDNLIYEDGGRRLTIDSSDATNVGIGLQGGDAVLVTYRYRGSDPIVLAHQPATTLISVEGVNSGVLDEGSHYEFVKTVDFLLDGRSVLDGAAVQLRYDSQSRKPIGTIEEFEERSGNRDGFILTTDYRELSKRGILEESILVETMPLDESDPVTLELNRQYVLRTDTRGSFSIKMIGSDSRFPSGQRYRITYQYGEEIVIRYRVNNLIGRLQSLIDVTRHEAADVLVKAALPVEIDVLFSLKVVDGADALDVKESVSDIVRTFIATQRLGGSVFESDLIYRIQQVDGVKHVVLPLSKLARVDGAYETEPVRSGWSEIVVGTGGAGEMISYWQTPQNALSRNTLGTSAEPNRFWGVRENGTPLQMVGDLSALVAEKGTFLIDATGTISVNPKSTDEVGNPLNDADPHNNAYEVAYRIAGESGSQDIVIQPNEYARLADLIVEVVER